MINSDCSKSTGVRPHSHFGKFPRSKKTQWTRTVAGDGREGKGVPSGRGTRSPKTRGRTLPSRVPGLFFLVLALLALCAGAAGLHPGAARAAGESRIVLGSIGEPSNLNPYISSDSASHDVAGFLFVAPLRYDRNLRLENWAAERVDMSADGRRLVIKLREDIVWEDGVPLTAEDLVFTVKLVADPKTGSPYAEDYMRISSVKALDRYTVEVLYDEYYARALVSFCGSILPKHVLEGQDVRTGSFARRPVGAGPYVLDSWESGSRVVLRANPRYFMGRAGLDTVLYRVIPDTATMFMELRAGRLDMMGLSPEQYLRQTSGGMWDTSFRKYRALASAYTYLGFNMRHPFFQDVRVRRALSMALDRDEIVKGALLGQGVPAFGPYKPGTEFYHPTLRPVAQDLEGAKRLLAEAGFADTDGDGVLERDGRKFEFTVLTNQGNAERVLVAIVLQSQLAKVGVRVHVRTVEWAAFIREFVNKGAFDAVILGWTITPDPDLYQVWHSSQAVEGGLNFTFFRNAELDALLERGRRTADGEERKKIYWGVQEILDREQPYCFLYVPYSLPIISARFKGVEPSLAGVTWNMERWTVDGTAGNGKNEAAPVMKP